jgi:chemotaxis protein CheD
MQTDMAEMSTVYVKIGEYRIARNPEILACVGLGSCLAIVLYDAQNRIGGVAHTLLPRREEAKDSSNPAKFVDSAVHDLLQELMKQGSVPPKIEAKIFGGANMFPDLLRQPISQIGERNLLQAHEELAKWKIKIAAQDVGGSRGRTIHFNSRDGTVSVKVYGQPEKVY